MGLLENLRRSALYVLSIGTMVSSAALIPVIQSRRQAAEKRVRDESDDRPRDFLKEMR
jgi:hypothetical protein